MKRSIPVFLVLALVLSLAAPCAQAAVSETAAQQAVTALGIMVGDENGNMNLTNSVTRAQFAKMMIAASTYKDTVGSTAASSPFKDVNYKYWAASYIQKAVTAGWLTGYTDGTYRPDNGVKLEEAATAVLKMLGYTTSDFSGAFPDAQLSTYAAVGLSSGVSKSKGQYLTRQDAMYLFYNLMTAKVKSTTGDAKYYAATLGYTVNSNGELDYTTLVNANRKGPFIVESSGWTSTLPFSVSSATIYKNGVASTVSAVANYDVYYYNTAMRTVWVYRNQVTGVYTAAKDSTAAPSKVTVAGTEYSVSTSAASFALSTNGSYKIGDTLTLLLGMNGDVVGVAPANAVSAVHYGVVTKTSTRTYTDSYGKTYTQDSVTMACTDGSSYEFYTASDYVDVGQFLRVSYDNGTLNCAPVTDHGLSGQVNSAGTAVGSSAFASDIQIMDTTSNGAYALLYPSRLAGLYLTSENVRYYLRDADGKISVLVLQNATGDAYHYGFLTYTEEKYTDDGNSCSYRFLVDGETKSYSSSTSTFSVNWGPALIDYSAEGSVVAIRNLRSLNLTSVTSQYAYKDSTKYLLADNVAVFIENGSEITTSTLNSVLSGGYTLTGYYDGTLSTGTRLRVIVAS